MERAAGLERVGRDYVGAAGGRQLFAAGLGAQCRVRGHLRRVARRSRGGRRGGVAVCLVLLAVAHFAAHRSCPGHRDRHRHRRRGAVHIQILRVQRHELDDRPRLGPVEYVDLDAGGLRSLQLAGLDSQRRLAGDIRRMGAPRLPAGHAVVCGDDPRAQFDLLRRRIEPARGGQRADARLGDVRQRQDRAPETVQSSTLWVRGCYCLQSHLART